MLPEASPSLSDPRDTQPPSPWFAGQRPNEVHVGRESHLQSLVEGQGQRLPRGTRSRQSICPQLVPDIGLVGRGHTGR